MSNSAKPLTPSDAEAPVAWFATPMGWKPFHLLALRGHEELNQTYRYNVRVHVSDPKIDPATLLGTLATAGVRTASGTTYFSGYVSEIDAAVASLEMDADDRPDVSIDRTFELTLVPWTWFLAKSASCAVFEQQDIPAVLERFLGEHPASAYRMSVAHDYPKSTFFVQYRETDLNFVQRLVEHVGIVTYFEHRPDGHELLLLDDMKKIGATLPAVVLDARSVRNVTRTSKLETSQFVLRASQPGATSSTVEATTRAVGRAPDAPEMFDFEGTAQNQQEAAFYARLRIEEQMSSASRLRAVVSDRAIRAGTVVQLPRFVAPNAGPYLVVSSDVQLSVGADNASVGLETGIEVTAAKGAFRPERRTPVPVINGSQVARVVASDVSQVKVRFQWTRGQAAENGVWLPLTRAALGARGDVPGAGTDVLVDFLEGDPNRPIVVGVVAK